MRIRVFFFLFVISILFLVTRLYKISKIPPSVYWDEASIGYNAYAVGIDGKDEWGSFLPLHFRAFGEFKLPVYIYSVTPFVKILGLNNFSVRFPSVLYSLGVVFITYLLAKRISKSETVSIFSAFFVAVTPWLYIFSRTGYEATAGLMFFLIGIYFYLESFKNQKSFFPSTFAFVASIYSYNSFRVLSLIVFLPLTAYLVWTFRRKFQKIFSVLVISLVFFALCWIPIIRLYKYDTGGQRLVSVGLSGTVIEKMGQFASNYIDHYSPKFLFSEGDTNLRSQMPGFGQLYWVSLPFVILGLFKIFKEKSFFHFLILFLLLAGPIPAALTRESPHALRAITMLPSFALISGFGLEYIIENYKRYSEAVLLVTVALFLVFFGLYLMKFFTNYSELSSSEWQYEYKEIFEQYQRSKNNNQTQVISDKYGQPYIFALYYLKYLPEDFRRTVKYNPPDKWGFSTVESFNGLLFKNE